MKLTTASILALPLLAVATPLEVRQNGSCDTGSLQCCTNTISSTSAQGNVLLGLLGIVLSDVTGLLGLGCSPISVVGVGSGNACTASPVCCSNNSVGGLINIGCIPITL
uniref:Hydrophobin n=1 Tax=Phlebiopsis gigantea TaxID=82310 RepID=C0KTY2_PHLGI|nr:hydrophobin [Phlebiopsis gigantea]